MDSLCLIPTLDRRWGAVLLEILVHWQWLPENVIANPLISLFGEVKARPPPGLKGHFRVFFLSLGVSMPLIFP